MRGRRTRPRGDARRSRAVDEALACWLELTPALVVNRLSAMGSNSSKPYQAALIAQAGFAVPDTLVTNDPDALRAFWQRHGSIIYKSCSGVRSIVSRLAADDADRLARLATCPTQFQEYVPGTDYRVHVIGDEIHGHAIDSDADDYRYAGRAGVRLQPWRVPDELRPRVRSWRHRWGWSWPGSTCAAAPKATGSASRSTRRPDSPSTMPRTTSRSRAPRRGC